MLRLIKKYRPFLLWRKDVAFVFAFLVATSCACIPFPAEHVAALESTSFRLMQGTTAYPLEGIQFQITAYPPSRQNDGTTVYVQPESSETEESSGGRRGGGTLNSSLDYFHGSILVLKGDGSSETKDGDNSDAPQETTPTPPTYLFSPSPFPLFTVDDLLPDEKGHEGDDADLFPNTAEATLDIQTVMHPADATSPRPVPRTMVSVLTSVPSFFRIVDTVECVESLHGAASEYESFPWRLLLILLLCALASCIAIILLIALPHSRRANWTHRSIHQKAAYGRTNAMRMALFLLCVLGVTGWLLLFIQHVSAATTTPPRIVYNGHLLDSSGDAIAGDFTIRFSWWTTPDFVDGDVDVTGAINIDADTYAGWQEEHTVTPNADGFFSIELGSVAAFPDIALISPEDLLSLALQVEVKTAASPATAYEQLDVDAGDDTLDRPPLRSVPFALNADRLDRRDVGTGSGSIPVLGPGGVFDASQIPSKTNSGAFIIDADDSESASVVLQFGSTIGKQLSYEKADAWFLFDDDVHIQGDLTVTGLVNGIDLSSITEAAATGLQVSSGAGLNISVLQGAYRLDGDTVDFGGDSDIAMTDDTTNYVFFGSGGLAVNAVGFPDDEGAIRLAEVVTVGGAISQVRDRRVFASDDRMQSVEFAYHPAFPNAAYQADATNNVGQLQVSHDATSKRNFYLWTSTRESLQDYDISVPVSLPVTFSSWAANPLLISYRSTSDDITDAKLDISVFDTNGVPVTLSGSSVNLVSTIWKTTQLEYSGDSTWTPGQEFLVTFKMSARNNEQMHLGDVKMNFHELNPR